MSSDSGLPLDHQQHDRESCVPLQYSATCRCARLALLVFPLHNCCAGTPDVRLHTRLVACVAARPVLDNTELSAVFVRK
jgi:hypothetical protein